MVGILRGNASKLEDALNEISSGRSVGNPLRGPNS